MAERVTISIAGQDEGGKALIRDVIAQLNAAATAEGKAAAGARELSTAGSRAATDLGRMESTLSRLVTLLGAASIVRFTKEAVDQADAMRDLSQKTGVQVEELSVLALAAARAGADSGTLTTGLRGLSKTLTDLTSGGSEAVQAFQAIGLSARDFDGLSLDQSVKKIADAMAGYADGAGKAAVAQKIFGRSGTELLPLLKDLSGDGLAKVTAEAERLGAVISTDAANAADQFNDALTDGKTAALGFAREFATSVLPPITEFLKLSAELAAEVPPEMKVFIGVLALTTAGALGTAAALLLLNGALVAFVANPAVAAIAVLAVLAGGFLAVAAAQERGREEDRKALNQKAEHLNRTRELVTAYERERRAIESGTLSGKNLEDTKKRLKAITDELVKLSPKFQAALSKEGKSADDAVAAIKRLNDERVKQLEFQELIAAVEVENTRQELAEAQDQRRTATGVRLDFLNGKVELLTGNLERARKKQEDLNAAIARARGLETPTTGTPGQTPPTITLPDPALIAARLAAEKQAIANERALFDENQKLEQQRNEQAFARGLTGLTQYFAERRAILTENIDAEFLALQRQKAILEAAPATTQAEQLAKRTQIAELDAKIAQQRVQEIREREALDEDERTKRIQLAQQILGFEAQIRGSRQLTVEETNKAIDEQIARYELALRQQGQLSEEALQQILTNARAALTDRGAFERLSADVDAIFSDIERARQRIDDQVRAGLLSQEDAERQLITLERQRQPQLRAIAEQMLQFARNLKDPALIQAAEDLTTRIGSMGISFDEARARLSSLRTDVRQAFQQDLAQFLGSTINDVHNLRDAFRELALTVVQSLQRIAAELVSSSITSFLGRLIPGAIGGAGRSPSGTQLPLDSGVRAASGGLITGPGSGTSDSIPAYLSNREFVVNAEDTAPWLPFLLAINRGEFRSLAPLLTSLSKGLRVPQLRSFSRVPRFADGGLVLPDRSTSPNAMSVGGEIGVRVGLDRGLILRELKTTAGAEALADVMQQYPSLFRSILSVG